jgi:hypothetical protein
LAGSWFSGQYFIVARNAYVLVLRTQYFLVAPGSQKYID